MSDQASEWFSGANGWASGPVLKSGFLAVLDNSVINDDQFQKKNTKALKKKDALLKVDIKEDDRKIKNQPINWKEKKEENDEREKDLERFCCVESCM